MVLYIKYNPLEKIQAASSSSSSFAEESAQLDESSVSEQINASSDIQSEKTTDGLKNTENMLEHTFFKLRTMQRLDKIKEKDSLLTITPESGIFLVIELTIKNNGNEALDFSSRNFKLLQGSTVYAPTSILGSSSHYFLSESLNPGLEKTGKLVFEVPLDLDDRNLVLNYVGTAYDNPTGELNLELK